MSMTYKNRRNTIGAFKMTFMRKYIQHLNDKNTSSVSSANWRQKEKVYVQHKMQRHAQELFDWIESGAHIYVCGCKDPMSYDVEKTLLNIIAQEKNISAESANEYLDAMKEAGRYHKDVY